MRALGARVPGAIPGSLTTMGRDSASDEVRLASGISRERHPDGPPNSGDPGSNPGSPSGLSSNG